MPFHGVLCTVQDKRRRYNCACIVGACASPNKNRLHTANGGHVQIQMIKYMGRRYIMTNLEQIQKDVKEYLKQFGYSGDIADKIISIIRPGVVLVEINGVKMEMYL